MGRGSKKLVAGNAHHDGQNADREQEDREDPHRQFCHEPHGLGRSPSMDEITRVPLDPAAGKRFGRLAMAKAWPQYAAP